MDAELAREWIAAARSLQGTMERFQQLPHRRAIDATAGMATNTGHIEVRLEGGKVPWLLQVSVTATILCAVLSIITLLGGGMLYLNMKDHLDAIYMMAPQLQPETMRHEHHHSDPQAQDPASRPGSSSGVAGQ